MPAIKKVQSIRNCTFWFPDWTFPTRCTQMSRPVDRICIVPLGEQSWCTKDIMDIPSRSVEVDNPADASWEALLPNMPCGLREAAEQTSMLFGPNCKLFDFVWKLDYCGSWPLVLCQWKARTSAASFTSQQLGINVSLSNKRWHCQPVVLWLRNVDMGYPPIRSLAPTTHNSRLYLMDRWW